MSAAGQGRVCIPGCLQRQAARWPAGSPPACKSALRSRPGCRRPMTCRRSGLHAVQTKAPAFRCWGPLHEAAALPAYRCSHWAAGSRRGMQLLSPPTAGACAARAARPIPGACGLARPVVVGVAVERPRGTSAALAAVHAGVTAAAGEGAQLHALAVSVALQQPVLTRAVVCAGRRQCAGGWDRGR